jgi:hypothetical protein
MSNHHHRRTVGVKDKDHGNHYPTSVYEPDGTAKKYKPNGTASTGFSRGLYSGMESTLWQVSNAADTTLPRFHTLDSL